MCGPWISVALHFPMISSMNCKACRKDGPMFSFLVSSKRIEPFLATGKLKATANEKAIVAYCGIVHVQCTQDKCFELENFKQSQN